MFWSIPVTHAWLRGHLSDPYVKRAQREGYRSRAVYKLQEIDQRDKLIRPGLRVIDLGAAPGSWSQYVRNRLARGIAGGGLNGAMIALDLLPMEEIAGVLFIQGDFREAAVGAQLEKALGARRADLVLSDMAPNLSGIAAADAARIEHLGELTLEFAQRALHAQGALLAKYFHGSGYSQMVERFRRRFQSVAVRKPKASRSGSSEVFILGKSLKSA
ncbi:Ribosomal RNA large subunit methyltransferase J (rRNA (uridine-2'-O-)-methyltransferase) (23S rRNA methyltransferase) [Candidatus Glomeribacter gigasporarum BEG34]|uniref:Ribosomal RNA large subunit methyltransferase E n=1 Tax=Candidatus Glomeribacter gigasporarum BEG34 TaxID=1070319 RepID=G2J9N8_9BURK|nr:Ribosomal RNA large subunit methyltransferase J (rRNA (uridine-2'-O-)-methyltransferase) (23S rRNA methyltransferase) [Candidatus Glomeribacter gigasporarum BEG34]